MSYNKRKIIIIEQGIYVRRSSGKKAKPTLPESKSDNTGLIDFAAGILWLAIIVFFALICIGIGSSIIKAIVGFF